MDAKTEIAKKRAELEKINKKIEALEQLKEIGEQDANFLSNFIEGMACVGGCINGAGCLTHGEKNKAEVDKYGREALEKTITDAVSILK